ncbi:ABC-type transporter, periplasmic subunit family 3 [uncultured delta proteobacterium]|uniref:ABC-type transporter, periplasmic subunit family 3 n=1 Tax=uncultured delta proteobacterium TaxID=34034 RepID=A0A212KCG8_9DELT|nr:ABC-type transporter, periplasmic subunit family 3 [uncultured delta proteobacterium]
MIRKVFLFAVFVFSGIAAAHLPAVFGDEAFAASRPVRVIYGFDREFAPFSFEDPGGKPVGFEVEIVEAIFSGSASLVSRPLQWDIIPVELGQGVVTITSGMVKTEERTKSFLFSDMPTLSLQVRLFTKNYNRYPNATFLRGQRVAVEQGSYQHRLLQNFGGINIKPFKDKVTPLKALFNDEVEAYCGPVQSAYYYMGKLGYSGMSTLGTPLGITELRIAVNRDRGDILRMVNDGMKMLVESGEYDRIYRKWFVQDLNADESLKLLNAAKEATLPAYTPYSRQTRGAAVLTATGQIYKGSAVENSDKALSVTAVTAALANAIGSADIEIKAVICVDADGRPVPVSPEERQRLLEFGRGILVLNFDEAGLLTGTMAGAGLPPAGAPGPRAAL